MANVLDIQSLSAISHILSYRPDRIERLIISGHPDRLPTRVAGLVEQARKAKVPLDFSSKPSRDSEIVRAQLAAYEYTDFKALAESQEAHKRSVILALDHLQDPQNFGALCRSAEGLGVAGVILPRDRSVAVTAGVYHASVGAVETLPIALVNNLGDGLRKLKDRGYWIVGAAMGEGATPASEMPDFEKVVLVMGAEGDGLSAAISKTCDWKLKIPLVGKIESLNVSAAGAILLHELCRKGTL